MKKIIRSAVLLAVLAGFTTMQQARSQVSAQRYPTKTVRIIVPTPVGGPGDTIARGTALVLSQALGQSFIVENRLGMGSIVGADACAKSTPDGYTLCSTDGYAITLNPHVYSRLPYNPQQDFTPIVHFGFVRSGLSVHPSVPANSLGDLLELARAKPSALAWGSYGPASPSHFYIEWLRSVRGIHFLNVPYKAAGEAMQRMIAAEVQVVTFALGQTVMLAKAGKVRVLAVPGSTRSPLLPDMPSFKESGLIDFSILGWFGLFAPTGTPNDIVQRVNAELSRVIPAPGFKDKFLSTQGIELSPPAGGASEAFAAYIKEEFEMYAKLVKLLGVKLD